MALPAVALLCRPVFLVAGFVWPSYASYKALEGRSTEPITVWLTYWVALSFVTVFSALLDPLVGSWMPLYYPLQLGLVLWLMLPQTKGASILYSQLLLPLLSKHEASIDHVLEVGKRKTEEWGARLLPATSNPDRNPTEDHEEAGGGVFRQWDFSQSVPDREAGLRGRPTGASFNYASLYTSSLAAGATPMEHPPTTRPELFGDRSAPRALAPGAVLGGSKEEVDPAARTKESKMK